MTAGNGAPNIEIDEVPDPSLRDQILKPLRAFNERYIGPVKAEPLAITLRDPEDGAVTGGLWGNSAAGWLFVDLLVVPEAFRSQGIGTALLGKAEDIARKRGCIGLWLSTGTFQAPAFYEKLGFKIFGTMPDHPPGHATIFYLKRLDT
jgi:GNAT superfamily N-acetyltransferase